MLERLRRAFSDITNDDRTDVLQSGVGSAPSYTDNVYKAVIPNFLYKPPFGYPMFKDIPEIKRMAKVPHVIMVTNTICNEIAGLDWDIYKHEDYEDLVPDEIVKKTKDWFLNPNRNDESFEMIMRTLVRDILEIDAGVVVKVRNLKDEFLEMYVRDGGTFTKNPDIYGIMPDERAYYQYGWLTGARPQEFNRNEIAYFMLNPRSDSIYGMSNVEVLMNTLQLLTYGIDANLEYFTDNNIPKGVLKMINANADDIKAFKQAWSEQMKTKDQAGKWRKQFHKMPIINTDGSFERIAFSNVELEFIQQQEWFVKLVWACYGVTPSELGFTDDSNRATDMVQSSIFKRKLIRPLTQVLEYNFNRNIVNDLPWIKGKFENMVLFEFNKVDTQEDLNRRQIIWGDIEKGFRTVNECREDEELDPIEGGDELRNKISGSFEGFNPFNGGKKEDDGESVRREFDGEEDDVDFGLKSFELKHKYIKRTGSPGNYVYHYADGSTSKKPKESDGGPALVSPISKKLDKLNEKRQNILKKISAADKKYAALKKKDDLYAGELYYTESSVWYQDIQNKLASASADLDDLGSELDSVEGQISDVQNSVKAEKAVKEELDDLVKNIDEFTRGDLQGVVEALADKYDGDSDKMLKYVDNKVKENDSKKESGGKEASGSKVEDTKIEDLRNIAEDVDTSDLQGVTMALANDLIGASFSDLSGSKDLRAIANEADNVLLEFANGEIELDEVKESIAGLRKEYSVAKNKTGGVDKISGRDKERFYDSAVESILDGEFNVDKIVDNLDKYLNKDSDYSKESIAKVVEEALRDEKEIAAEHPDHSSMKVDKLKKKSLDLKHKYKRRVRRGNKWVYFYDDIKPRIIGSGTGFEGSKEKLISKAMSYNESVKASDKAIIEKSKRAVLNKKDSFSVNQVNGVWNFERKRIHNSIRKSYFKDAKLAVSKEPKIIFMAGLPGSGKTFSVSQYYEPVKGTKLFKDKKSGENFLVLNSDDIKKELPGFENGAGSMFVHEESSYLNKQLVRKFMDKKVNVIIDGTMKTKSSASKLLSKSKEKGYKSKLIYVDVSHDVSLDRVKARYERSGRYVPYNFIVGIGDDVDNTVGETRKDFDGFLHIDNNVKPVVIEREGI